MPVSPPTGARSPGAPGTLFVIATPIGNLGDLAPRALETLRAVAAVCAEDTRRTRQLLGHFGLDRPLLEHNEAHLAGGLVARLLAGESLALVSDAGQQPRDQALGEVRLVVLVQR